jgi:Transglycosylase SLT domain
MKHLLSIACLAFVALLMGAPGAQAGRAEYEALVAKHAKANAVPEALVHRVIVRESRYQPELIGHGGTIGLMQIKLATARGLGYTGDAAGLRDPDTNLTYGVKYLAGAYRVANGDHDRAVHYYAAGYYVAAKQQRLLERERIRQASELLKQAGLQRLANTPKEDPKPEEAVAPAEEAKPEAMPPPPVEPTNVKAADAPAQMSPPVEAAIKPEPDAAPKKIAAVHKSLVPKQTQTAAKPKPSRKNLADADGKVPRPPASIPGANAAKPR